jgi:hypothetical protein
VSGYGKAMRQPGRKRSIKNKPQTSTLHLCLVLSGSEKKRKILFFGKIFRIGRNTKVGFRITFAADFESLTKVL